MNSAAQSLDQLIAQHNTGQGELPNLLVSKPFSLWGEIVELVAPFIRELLDKILGGATSRLSGDRIMEILAWTVLAGFITLVVVLGVVIYRHMVKKSPGRLNQARLAEIQSPHQEIDLLISSALSRGDYAAALRYRWRLFLMRTSHAPGMTLVECGLENTELLYGQMFGRHSGVPQTYRQFDGILSGLES